MNLTDTNQLAQIIQNAQAVHSQLSPFVPAFVIAAGWAGRELSRFNAWALGAGEKIIAHGGLLKIAKKLFWN